MQHWRKLKKEEAERKGKKRQKTSASKLETFRKYMYQEQDREVKKNLMERQKSKIENNLYSPVSIRNVRTINENKLTWINKEQQMNG